MNPEFYTEEFRTFKYISSPNSDYYKQVEDLLTKVQPFVQINDPNFKWQKRVEFPEQLVDLRGNDLWFVGGVDTILQTRSSNNYVENINLLHIPKSIPHFGFPQKPGRFITQDDLPGFAICDWRTKPRIYISSSSHYYNVGIEAELITDTDPMICLDMWSLPVFPRVPVYDSIFYDKAWAELYNRSIIEHTKKIQDAVSTISWFLLG